MNDYYHDKYGTCIKRATMALYVYITGFDFMFKNWPLLDFYFHRFIIKGPLAGECLTYPGLLCLQMFLLQRGGRVWFPPPPSPS
jgi:hypothetical protein